MNEVFLRYLRNDICQERKAPLHSIFSVEPLNDTAWAVQTFTKALKDLKGEYRVAVYAMQNRFNAPQAPIAMHPESVEHKNILRRPAEDKAFGHSIIDDTASAGAVFEKKFILEKKGYWNLDNTTIVVKIWKADEAGIYTIVNAAK